MIRGANLSARPITGQTTMGPRGPMTQAGAPGASVTSARQPGGYNKYPPVNNRAQTQAQGTQAQQSIVPAAGVQVKF